MLTGQGIEKGKKVEVPKSMVVERVRSLRGPEATQKADEELPDKLDLDSDAELLSKHDIDPDTLRDEFGGQSPAAT